MSEKSHDCRHQISPCECEMDALNDQITFLIASYNDMKLSVERGRPPPLEGEGIPADDCDGCDGTGSLRVWVYCEDCLGTGKGAADE